MSYDIVTQIEQCNTQHKYTLTNTSYTSQVKQQEKEIDKDANEQTTMCIKYTDNNVNTNNIVVVKVFWERRNDERFTSNTFIRLNTCAHKKARQSRQQSVKI